VVETFGLVLELLQVLRPIYEKPGLDIPVHNGDETFEMPVPATYIINRKGKIVYHFIDADYTRRSEPEKILTALSTHSNQ
jgi:peroxiredoxin